jgi:galactose mutarotase-like enzyme
VDTLGAQMIHLQSANGTEYLWQGDPAYWADRSPVLFPFIGRLTDNSYRYCGKVYPMGIHGFAAASEFTPVEQTENRVVLELSATPETKLQYPFDFSFKITYALEENTLSITYCVNNLDEKVLPFGVGGHPGFNVPLLPGERFEDYRLIFSQACQPDRVGFTSTVYLSGVDEAYPLKNGKEISLRHDLFDEDAIIFKNMAREVTLKSNVSGHGVTVSYPDMAYLGIWHWPKTDAPYVCIEPWTSLPARQDVVEEFSCKSDMIQLAPGKSYDTTWTVTLF